MKLNILSAFFKKDRNKEDFDLEKYRKSMLSFLSKNKEGDEWVSLLIKILPEYNINTKKRLAHFMSQAAHENDYFRKVTENLNYSYSALRRVFKKYFTESEARKYARNPEKIANIVYANRMGNGDTKSGDGWKFRGRGVIQCTGKNNYTDLSVFLHGDHRLLKNPDLIAQNKEYAIRSACWYWSSRSINSVADDDNGKTVKKTYRGVEITNNKSLVKITKIINGGYNGLSDRQTKFESFLSNIAHIS